jgi:transposase
MAVVAATLGLSGQTLYNWVKADREGQLIGADNRPVSAEQMELDNRPVSAEQMELARLRAEVARLKMERDILKKGETQSQAFGECLAA